MRKLLTSIVLFMLFSMFSGTAFAAKYPECDVFKGYKRLYGLCNAYQNAVFHQDEEAMADISRNWDKWWDEDDGLPGLPNRPSDANPVCPCWTYETLESAIRCDGFEFAFASTDDTGDGTGKDTLVLQQWLDGMLISQPQLTAGAFFPEAPDRICLISAPTGLVDNPMATVEGEIDLQCRQDVVDLAAEALEPAPCEL